MNKNYIDEEGKYNPGLDPLMWFFAALIMAEGIALYIINGGLL